MNATDLLSLRLVRRLLAPGVAALVLASPMHALSETERSAIPEARGVQLELIEAIMDRDEAAFEEALARGADPGSIDSLDGQVWALCEAAATPGHSSEHYFLSRLLEAGADPNVRVPNRSVLDETALSCALSSLRRGAVSMLLRAGADDSTVMCPECISPETPFTMSLGILGDEFALATMARRELDELELERLKAYLRRSRFDGEMHEGQPLRTYFESYLRERGVTPAEPRRR